jgi:hypothetical protein
VGLAAECSGEESRVVRSKGEDRGEQKVIDDIAEFGWHCMHIGAEREFVEFTFTIGLFQTYRHPELILFGLPSKVAHQVLSIAADAAKSGEPLKLTEPTDALLEGYPCCFAEVLKTKYREYVGIARWYYEGDDFPLVQIVWPARSGHFPWDQAATAEFKRAQPVIGHVVRNN